MLQMKLKPDEVRMFNMDKFIALWGIDKEQAREYQRDCEEYRQEYCLANNPELRVEVEIDWNIVSSISTKDQTVDIIDENKPVIEEKEMSKEDMVKLLRENGMKLARTTWSEETLKKHVANIK